MSDKKPEPEVFAIVEHEPGMLTRRSFVKAAIGLSTVGALSTLSDDAQAVQSGSGKCDKGALAHSKAITDLTGHPVSECFVSVGKEGKTKVWSAPLGALMRSFNKCPTIVTFTREGKGLFVPRSFAQGSTMLSLPDGSELATSDSTMVPRFLAVSPEGKRLAAIDDDGNLSFFDATTGQVLRSMHGGEPLNELGHTSDGKLPSPRGLWFSASGDKLLLLDWQKRLWWVNYFDDSPATRALLDFPVSGTYPQLSAGGRLVQQVDDRGIVWLQMEPGQTANRVEAPSEVLRIALSKDGSKVAGILKTGRVAVWNLGGDPAPEIHRPSKKALSLIEFGKDSDSLLLGIDEKKLGFYSISSKRMVGLYTGHKKSITAITSVGKDSLASGDEEGRIIVWDTEKKVSACLMDIESSDDRIKGITVTRRLESGGTVTMTLPCGTDLPSGSVCTCNCVAGNVASNPRKGNRNSSPSKSYRSRGSRSYSYSYYYPN